MRSIIYDIMKPVVISVALSSEILTYEVSESCSLSSSLSFDPTQYIKSPSCIRDIIYTYHGKCCQLVDRYQHCSQLEVDILLPNHS